MTRLFVFGTLRDLALLELVLGRRPETRAAVLPGAAVWQAAGHDFPICLPAEPEAQAEGLVIEGLSETDLSRLDFYELGFGYARETAEIMLEDGSRVRAALYRPDGPSLAPDGAWDLAVWQDHYGPITRETAIEAMSYFGSLSPAEMAALWSVMEARAQSRIAARDRPAPRRGGLPDRAEIRTEKVEIGYNGFFRLEEHHLSYPSFNGGRSPVVSRVAFVSVDAVTLLPYDPVRDRVLLVDQFRVGPYVRGDAQPWTLEAVAGRVDGGESWEDAVHREAREEAGLTLWHLAHIGSYYPSPGAVTEYLASYIGLTDLPDSAAGLFGVAEEAEDIRAVLVDFDDLMAMTRDGRIQNGPLMISALRLAADRAALRAVPRPGSGATGS